MYQQKQSLSSKVIPAEKGRKMHCTGQKEAGKVPEEGVEAGVFNNKEVSKNCDDEHLDLIFAYNHFFSV